MKYIVKVACLLILFAVYITADETYLFMPINQPPPPACPLNEMWKYCLGNCSNCEQRGYCEVDCSVQGCDCIAHFVRLTPDGPCEPISKCPVPECGENEVWRECGPVCETCNMMSCRVIQCEHKCYCKQDYKRLDGKCIPEKECPPREGCPNFEEERDSGLKYEYCVDASDSDVKVNKTACYCMEGMKRNPMGHCINDTICEYIYCLGTEEFQSCPKRCNKTCRNYGKTDCEEDKQCYPGCFCKEGLLINDYRTCVPLEECPPGSNPFVPTPLPVQETTIPTSIFTTEEPKETGTTSAPIDDSTKEDSESSSNSEKIVTDEGSADPDDVDREEPSEVSPDDDDSDDKDSKTTEAEVSSPSPTKRPTKRPKGGKSKSYGSTSAKASAKSSSDAKEFDDRDFNDND